ncbi:MAG TPA: hypothetical protein VGN35_10185 [Jatrophihabitantaceae bacterium]|nr:hypothetical protein [Jatrophihabitantaceae bacterium]
MIETDLRRLLTLAADDRDAPLTTPAWIRVERVRARRARQRQVGIAAVLGVASTIAGVTIAISASQPDAAPASAGGRPPTAAATTPASSSPSAGGSLAPVVIVHTATKTVVGANAVVQVPRVETRVVTTTVPGSLRTALLHDTVTATTTETATVTTTDTVTSTVHDTVRATTTVTTTRVPPPNTVTVTVTVTAPPSQPTVP